MVEDIIGDDASTRNFFEFGSSLQENRILTSLRYIHSYLASIPCGEKFLGKNCSATGGIRLFLFSSIELDTGG